MLVYCKSFPSWYVPVAFTSYSLYTDCCGLVGLASMAGTELPAAETSGSDRGSLSYQLTLQHHPEEFEWDGREERWPGQKKASTLYLFQKEKF